MNANQKQVGGDHYKKRGINHWDLVYKLGWDYFRGQVSRYVVRYRDKDMVKDLKKAQHYIEKMRELTLLNQALLTDKQKELLNDFCFDQELNPNQEKILWQLAEISPDLSTYTQRLDTMATLIKELITAEQAIQTGR